MFSRWQIKDTNYNVYITIYALFILVYARDTHVYVWYVRIAHIYSYEDRCFFRSFVRFFHFISFHIELFVCFMPKSDIKS